MISDNLPFFAYLLGVLSGFAFRYYGDIDKLVSEPPKFSMLAEAESPEVIFLRPGRPYFGADGHGADCDCPRCGREEREWSQFERAALLREWMRDRPEASQMRRRP